MIVNNLSKSPSLARFSSEKCVGGFCKGCVHYIFASLFGKPKGKHLWHKEKYFLLHFENDFSSWDNQILILNLNFKM